MRNEPVGGRLRRLLGVLLGLSARLRPLGLTLSVVVLCLGGCSGPGDTPIGSLRPSAPPDLPAGSDFGSSSGRGPTPSQVCPAYDTSLLPGVLKAPEDTTQPVGSIGGSFSVDDDGNATYRMPIAVPPGHGGMAPRLALVYRSNGGDGPLGMGFSLAGTSTIERCGRNQADDKDNGPPRFDASDAFCLGSQRLVLVDGIYGEVAEYRTTPDEQLRIRSYVRQAGGPAYFRAWTRDGRVLEYQAGQIAPFAVVRNWRLVSERDAAGNEIRYAYSTTPRFAESGPYDAEVVLSRIDYTFTTTENETPVYSVHFEYEARPDRREMYSLGVALERAQRMSRIVVRDRAGQELRRYLLGYDGTGGSELRSKLGSVEVCSGASCLRPTTFSWTRAQAGVDLDPSHALSTQYQEDAPPKGAPLLADLDGDGRTDILRPGRGTLTHVSTPGASLPLAPADLPSNDRVFLDYDLDGRMDVLSWPPSSGDSGNSGNFRVTKFDGAGGFVTFVSDLQATPGTNPSLARVVAQDLNGDGRKELIECSPLLGWTVRYQIGPKSFTAQLPIGPLNDLAALDPILPCSLTLVALDVDGDGDTDFLAQNNASLLGVLIPGPPVIVSLEVDGFHARPSGLSDRLTWYNPVADAHYASTVLDVNGDGLPDVIAFDGSVPTPEPSDPAGTKRKHARLWLNTGAGFRLVGVVHPRLYALFQFPVTVVDWNGDGREDILYVDYEDPATGQPSVLISNGDGSFERFANTSGVGGQYVLDANGDGLPDILSFSNTKTHPDPKNPWVAAYSVFLHAPTLDPSGNPTKEPPNRIVAINDGAHQSTKAPATVQISYAPLTDTSGWANAGGADASSTFRRCYASGVRDGCFVGARYVVAKEIHDGGATALASGQRIIRHAYTDARFDREGRGNIGFATHTMTTSVYEGVPLEDVDAPDAIVTVRELDQTHFPYLNRYPFAGRVKRQRTTVPLKDGSKRVTLQDWTWATRDTGASWFPYVAEERVIETRGKGNAELVLRHATTTFAVDELGNRTYEQHRAYLDATPFTGASEAQTITRVIANDTTGDNWHLGMVQSEVTQDDGEAPRVMTSEFDELGRVVHIVSDPDSATQRLETTLSRDAYGNIVSVVAVGATGGERRVCTSYTPDGLRPFAQSNPLGHISVLRFGASGELLGIRDPNGRDTLTAYDSFLRPVLQVAPGNVAVAREVRYLEPDRDAFTTTTVQNTGARSVGIHDRFGRALTTLRMAVSGSGGKLASDGLRIFDARGRLASWVHPQLSGEAAQTDTFVYDNDGRELQQKRADGTSVWFTQPWNELTGYVIEQTSLGLRTTKSTLDRRGRIASVVDAAGGVTTYGYRTTGALASLTDPAGSTTVIENDPYGRVTTLTDPNAGTTAREYDAYGQVVRETAADGAITEVSYDKAGRVRTRTDDDGLTRLLYDPPGALGALARSESADGVNRTFTYDGVGRLAVEQTEADGAVYEVAYGYDAVSQLDRVTYPSGPTPFVLRYWRNDFGDVTRIARELPGGENVPLWWKLEETAAGQTTSELFGNQTGTKRTYDPQTGRLTSIATKGPTPADPRSGTFLQLLSYTYDKVGNLATRADWLQGPGANVETGVPSPTPETERFTYDALDRLKSAKLDSAALPRYQYQYGPTGNLTFKQDVGAYTYEASRPHVVATAGPLAYAHDVRGRLTQRGPDTLAYTAGDRVRAVTTAGRTTTHQYDASNERVVTSDSKSRTVNVSSLYERKTTRLGDTLLATVRHRYFVHTPERMIAVAEESEGPGTVIGRGAAALTTTYVHVDHLGSPDVLSNSAGQAIERQSFDPFGQRRSPKWSSLVAPKASKLSEGYTGHEDDVAGLVNARGRTYDPRLGRFTSADPFVQAPFHSPSLNRYSYVWNNPLRMTDPSGYQTLPTNDVGNTVISATPDTWSTNGSMRGPTLAAPERADGPAASSDSHRDQGPPDFVNDSGAGGAPTWEPPGGPNGGGPQSGQRLPGPEPDPLLNPLDYTLGGVGAAISIYDFYASVAREKPDYTQVAFAIVAVVGTKAAVSVAKPLLKEAAKKIPWGRIPFWQFPKRAAPDFVKEARKLAPTVAHGAPGGHPTFDHFKLANGVTPGYDWHHIVEQHAGNVERFGAESIHHEQNLIQVPPHLHQQITDFYNSKTVGGMTVRDAVSKMSYEEQYAFGRDVVRRIAGL